MKIGVISDTHDRMEPVNVAMQYFRAHRVRHAIHCGDWTSQEAVRYAAERAGKLGVTLHGVFGNNDNADALSDLNARLGKPIDFAEGSVLTVTLGGRDIAAYHGHHRPTVNFLKQSGKYDVVMLGHRHKVRNEMVSGTLYLNPGSTAFAYPRSSQDMTSMAVYDTVSNSARIIYLATLRSP